jgi:hypothetical protein
MTAEVRARTLTGRTQVSEDGRRLVDGVPFGRPYLRHPNRPAVRIPPRKRQRLDEAEDEPDVAGLLTADEEAIELQGEAGLLTYSDTSAASKRPSRASRASKRVRFKAPEPEPYDDDDDESDEDDDDFAPGGEQVGDAAIDDDDSDDDSDSDTDTDESDSDSSSGSDSSSSGSDSDDSSSDSDSGSDASKGVLGTTNHELPSSPKHVAPGHGRPVTRSRNSRRTRTNRLRHLKSAGKLPQNADLKALDEYEAAQSLQTIPEPEASEPFSAHEGKRKRIDDDEDVDIMANNAAQALTELEQRKQELMARLGKESVSTMVQIEESRHHPAAPQESASPHAVEEEDQLGTKEIPKRRLRPDTSAISRILARQAMVRTLHYLTISYT